MLFAVYKKIKFYKMRTKIYIIVLAISLFSCSDFLEVVPETQLGLDNYYKTQKDFEHAINGAYTELRTLYDNIGLHDNRSDNAYDDYNASNRGQLANEEISNFVNDNTNKKVAGKWNSNYLIIGRVNQILATIDPIEFEEAEEKNNIKGQALFLRALSYFDLVQHFGSIPLHLTPVSNMQESALPKSSVDAIYDQIMEDVQASIGLLPQKSKQDDPGSATSGAARTLLANVYMVHQEWANAITQLQAIIDSDEYELITTSYADVFDPNNKNNSESIFEVQYRETEQERSRFLYLYMPAQMTQEEVSDVTGTSNPQERNGEGVLPTPDLIAAYEAGDERLDATIGYAGSSGNGADTVLPYAKKYNHTHSQHGITGDNFPIYRYSEVLLFLAEALNESGASAEALPHLNAVRDRAGLADATTTDQTQLRTAILAERRVEFALEGKRWLTLVRTGNAVSIMTAFGERVKANPQDYYFPSGIGPVDAAFTEIETLFPIPSDDELFNPKL